MRTSRPAVAVGGERPSGDDAVPSWGWIEQQRREVHASPPTRATDARPAAPPRAIRHRPASATTRPRSARRARRGSRPREPPPLATLGGVAGAAGAGSWPGVRGGSRRGRGRRPRGGGRRRAAAAAAAPMRRLATLRASCQMRHDGEGQRRRLHGQRAVTVVGRNRVSHGERDEPDGQPEAEEVDVGCRRSTRARRRRRSATPPGRPGPARCRCRAGRRGPARP